MTAFLQDLSEAFRRVRRNATSSSVTVVILFIGLSAASAAFGYVRAFARPFPGVDPEGLVRLFEFDDEEPWQELPFLDYLDYQEAGPLPDLAVAQPYYAASVRLEAMTEVAFIEAVTGNLFPLLSVEMAEGRRLEEADDVLSAEPAAVISNEWWQTLFGGDPEVLGTTIFLNYRPFTVVGVAAASFRGTAADVRPDVWIPIAHFRDRYTGWDQSALNRDVPLARVYGRLPSGMDRERAASELAVIAGRLDEAYPRERGRRQLRVEEATWIEPRAREAEASTLRALMIAAGGLLALVCANVANLLLAVSAGRRRETATRAALGASPTRLMRHGVMESLILSLTAGVASCFVARPLIGRLGGYFERPSVWGESVSREAVVDGGVLLFTLAAAVVAALVAGLAPAVRGSRIDLAGVMRAGDGSRPGGEGWLRGLGVRDLLVTTQVGLAVVLLVLAGVVVRTFGAVGDIDPGFAYEEMISSHISTSSTDIDPMDRGRFFDEVVLRLSEEPWVRAVGVKDNALLSGQPTSDVGVDGRTDPASMIVTRVIPGFFESVGIALTEGRPFLVGDSASAPPVAIVNQAAAEAYFGDSGALGRELLWPVGEGADTRAFEVVGVVADVRARDVLVAPEPTVFLAYHQHPYPSGSALHVVTAGPPASFVPQLERWIRSFEPHLAIVNVLPYNEVVAGSLYAQRMNAELFSVLAFLALVLGAFGIYSVLMLAVDRRTREVGVRMALGAELQDIRRLLMGRAFLPVVVGVAVGLVGAAALQAVVAGLLYGVEPMDPRAVLFGVAVLLAVTVLATLRPVRLALRVDPVEALRAEG